MAVSPYRLPTGRTLKEEIAASRRAIMTKTPTKTDEQVSFLRRSNAIQCSVCYRSFSDVEKALKPKSLPACGHTFCTFCIEKLNRKPCPTCRKVNDIDAEKVPINYALMNLIGEMQTERGPPPEIKDDPFVPCFENAKHESKMYCTDCQQAYCQRCFADAHSAKFMKDHKNIPVEKRPFTIPDCPNCPNGRVADAAIYYCPQLGCSENRITCIKCRNIHHRNHKVQMILPQLEKNYSKVEELLEKVQEKDKKVLKFNEYLGQLLDDADDQQSDHIAKIRNHFDNLKHNAITKYEKFMKKEEKKIENAMNQCCRSVAQIKGAKGRIVECLKRKRDLHDIDKFFKEVEGLKGVDTLGDFFPLNEYELTPDMSVEPKRPVKRPRLEDPSKDPVVAPQVKPVKEEVDSDGTYVDSDNDSDEDSSDDSSDDEAPPVRGDSDDDSSEYDPSDDSDDEDVIVLD
ncbi:hypothetical protein CAEBREN_12368 [Caenorhabditis brenneri]|uniref:RING-type domain-containing protein n=1 Tax=Caenorhabditis brenneri TaxID=135651 RepID=G0NC09_CAEBE|nr:hypothetical protein CAEBREN_12368 [Caenorhabditis brenneri]